MGGVLRAEGATGQSQSKSWVQGEWVCFNGSSQHESFNNGTSDRTVLLVDFFTEKTQMDSMRALLPAWLNAENDVQTCAVTASTCPLFDGCSFEAPLVQEQTNENEALVI